jgi:hypothetical protein
MEGICLPTDGQCRAVLLLLQDVLDGLQAVSMQMAVFAHVTPFKFLKSSLPIKRNVLRPSV